MKYPKDRVYIHEVVTRDGFQNEATFIPTDEKISLINRLGRCGVAKIEVTSFTSPKAIPALRDAEAVMQQIERSPDVVYTVLVPNIRGAERALSCQPNEVNLVMSTSESHNLANLRMGRDASFSQLADVIRLVRQTSVAINVSLSTAFGCPMEGDVSPAEVCKWAERFADLGVQGLTICDTTGMAYPAQVSHLLGDMRHRFPSLELTAHFHNTRGMALANSIAAMEVGIRRFDASLGGLGGCPYAPGATGNVCTEDLVHMFELNGANTGVDQHALLDVAGMLRAIVMRDTPGQVLKAGMRLDLHPLPAHVAQALALRREHL
ncbi:hydroxymethylglutaryl-CoA lyase [Pandoraea eparura]|uniref:Hydroxymethylglutaryl-CoA lyase n=1 Tax=Pandoraea eparura TaxID=2508291 RepID=A0A5E4U7K2_9BURK|nr:hydroxymethylglutaryl-CoA lyase [Pandoraea eparura]VVD94854.1 hydroxymethylglutaryl-CoA lyase [Pandoraea eparura]